MSPYVGLPGLNCTKTFSRKSLVWQQGKQKAYFYRLVLCCWWWCYSVAKSCLTFCDSMDCITLGFPVLHHLPELSQTHVHWVGDAIQPFCPLSSPSPFVFSLSQHQDLFQWVGSSYQVAKGLQLQHQSFQWVFRVDFLYDWLTWSSCCPRDSQESSPGPQFESNYPPIKNFFFNSDIL